MTSSRVLQVAYFLFIQVVLYPSGVFNGIEEQIDIVIVFLCYDKR